MSDTSGLKVYVRGRRTPFLFPNATHFEKSEDRIVLYDKRPSEANPYKSSSQKFQAGLKPLASFYSPTVDAVMAMTAGDAEEIEETFTRLPRGGRR